MGVDGAIAVGVPSELFGGSVLIEAIGPVFGQLIRPELEPFPNLPCPIVAPPNRDHRGELIPTQWLPILPPILHVSAAVYPNQLSHCAILCPI